MHEPPTAEWTIAAQLRTIAVDHIRDTALSDGEVSAKLGVAERTAHALLQRQRWDVTLAIRVADRLGLAVTVDRR